ncbi:patatin-like phospholipase family protein [Pontiellaceae bacterium B12219]|nr:patatin-like phospholipase family protein [Pontiellaceae bacterium B12219]
MILRNVLILVCCIPFIQLTLAEEEQPKIGLVLGGGGALGFAHIGVLKVLEEQQVPIDYIGGTSMGAIIAGMYASGMSPDEIEKQFLALNWWDVLKDGSQMQYMVYRRKQDYKRYMGLEVGFNDGKFQFPPGMSYGQKLNNVLENFSLNSAGITDFDNLNIPYRAVATDLLKGESVVLKSGSLARAMRASMAVPGAFTPVRMDGCVLVDGGILDNIPVNVVRNMGADYIIAVDLGASAAELSQQSDFQSLGSVLGRTYTIMKRPEQERQLKSADLVIDPDLASFSPTKFHLVDQIIPKGYAAAEQQVEQLDTLSVSNAEFQAYLKKQRRIRRPEIVIKSIQISGNKTVPDGRIRYRIRSEEGPIDLNTVYDDVSRIYGMELFQTVNYELKPNGDGYDLNYNAVDKFWGPAYIHFGMKLEASSETSLLWAMLLDYTCTQLNENGGEVRLELAGGGLVRGVVAEWYQPLSRGGRFFIAPAIELTDQLINIYDNSSIIAEVDQDSILGRLDAGISGFEYGEFRIGLQGGHIWDSGNSGIIPLPEVDETVIGLTTQLRLNQLDDPYFPTKGYELAFNGFFANKELGSDQTFSRVELGVTAPVTFGRHTLTPAFSAGSSLGTDLPFYAAFQLGGMDNFAGYAPYQRFGNYFGLASLGYRYRLTRLPPTLGDGVFAILRLDAGNTWMNSDDISVKSTNIGGLAGVGADTAIGRFIVGLGQAEDVSSPHFYLSVGNTF